MAKIDSVNEPLENFPFRNFEELQKEVRVGSISIGIDESRALTWAGESERAPKILKLFNKLEPSFLFFIVFLFLIFIIVLKLWWWFLSLPLLFLATLMFGPTFSKTMGNSGLYLIILFFGSLIYSLFSLKFGLLAFSSSLLLIDFSIHAFHAATGKIIQNIAAENEEVFRELWQNRIIGIKLSNGDSHFSS